MGDFKKILGHEENKKLGTLNQSFQSLSFAKKNHDHQTLNGSTLDVEDIQSTNDDLIVFGTSHGRPKSSSCLAKSVTRRRKSMESRKSIFNSMGSAYTLPKRDHNYKLLHGLKFGNFEEMNSE